MKYSEILKEMPYLNLGAMKITNKTSYSPSALIRDFKHITEYHHSNVPLNILMQNGTDMVVGVEQTLNVEGRHNCIFVLTFKEKLTFDYDLSKDNIIGKILQVDNVQLHMKYQASGLCSTIYKVLVKHGYVIVSDSTQFEPAQNMWKKIAKDNTANVIVFDCDYGPFKDSNGNVIKYNGTNIQDYDIWTIGSDFKGHYRLLCMY